ncbi:MAG: hypothetical protein ABIJ48_06150 [Actinomycetota bacterium]
MTAPRLLTIMGSGETTATMVPVHRAAFERFPGRPLLAVLDTPYGFQENADELTARALDYFHTSLPMADVEVASLRSPRQPAAAREQALDTLRRADAVYSGPGSPSYALRVWTGTPVPAILAAKLDSGGSVTMASAASVTLGRFALPVYEVYKVGADPFWMEGLDILGAQGIPAVVVPHWNNAEGGTHDTSRCWLGARRFATLARRLPPGMAVLGVDEHTACLLDFAAGCLDVAGKGTVTLIAAGATAVLGPGDSAPLPRLSGRPEPDGIASSPAPTRPEEAAAFETAFTTALEAGNTGAALDTILSLEDAHQSWEAAAAAAAHDALRSMATRFATTLAGRGLDGAARAGAVEALLGVRARARDDGRWADADAIRQALKLLAVEVRDTPGGTVWETVTP